MSKIKGTFECKNAGISDEKWMQCLRQIDDDIIKMYSYLNHVIIISFPYQLTHIKTTLQEFVLQTFGNHSIVFCFDIIIGFITYDKKYIQNQITSNYIQKDEKTEENHMNKWKMNAYDELVSHNSLIIINTKTCEYIAMPRNVKDLFGWKISWTKSEMDSLQLQSLAIYGFNSGVKYNKFIDENNKLFDEINKQICKQIQSKFEYYENKFENCYFELSEDWTKRAEFSDVVYIGYMCDSGVTIKGTLLRHKVGKIFIHFNTDGLHYGKLAYDWFIIPNDRICPPPKVRPPMKITVLTKPDLNCQVNYSCMPEIDSNGVKFFD